MNDWELSSDAFIRIGKTWVRQSSVVIVTETEDGGSRIHLANKETIKSNATPTRVVEALLGKGDQ